MIITEDYFRKVEFHCIISIHQAKSIICKRKRWNACCCVQFWFSRRNLGWVSCNENVCIHIIVHEVASAAESPVLTWIEHGSTPRFQVCFILSSIDVKFFSSTVDVQRVTLYENKIAKKFSWLLTLDFFFYISTTLRLEILISHYLTYVVFSWLSMGMTSLSMVEHHSCI